MCPAVQNYPFRKVPEMGMSPKTGFAPAPLIPPSSAAALFRPLDPKLTCYRISPG
jgi:hypothetical protein